MGCHGEAGLGLEGKVPSFRHTLAKISASPQGRDYVLRVPGVAQATLDDLETAEVLNWVLAEFSTAEAARRVAPFTETTPPGGLRRSPPRRSRVHGNGRCWK